MDLDLHLHSTASDGAVSPAELVSAAVAARLDVIALTDHDTVAGVPAALEAAAGHPIHVVPAVEMSSTWEDLELHILGYFVDPWNPALLEHTGVALRRRESRLRGMTERLAEQGVVVPFDVVLAQGTEGGVLGRPHLARALVATGHVESIPQAFDLYIGNDHDAYLPAQLIDPPEAIRLIREAGGLSVWAHPPSQHLDALLPRLKAAGLDGVEVYRPRMSRDRVLRLERAARAAGLLLSGGSDWHGPDDGALGEFRVQSSEISELLAAGGL